MSAAALTACGESALPPEESKSARKQPDVSCEHAVRLPHGVCVQVHDASPDLTDREAAVAAHPTDARTVALTWTAPNANFDAAIFVSVTTDGGRTWQLSELSNPVDEPGATLRDSGSSFAGDSTVGIGPDGTVYVSYLSFLHDAGARTDFLANPAIRLTVAASRDGGRSWTYHPVAQSAGTLFPDYPDLAVAPDTGHLYIVAQNVVSLFHPVEPPTNCLVPFVCPAPDRITVWKSTDGAKTWSEPAWVQPYADAEHSHPYVPRIAAGRDGVVAISTNARPTEGYVAGLVVVSRDGGETWSRPVRVHQYTVPDSSDPVSGGSPDTLINEPLAMLGGGEIAAVYWNGAGEVVGYRSTDFGATWTGPRALARAPAGNPGGWLSATGGTDSVYAEYRYGNADRFGTGFTRWRNDGRVENLTLVDAPGYSGVFMEGDDYGAIAVAADGTVWTAWMDPRAKGAQRESIALAHIVPDR